MQLGGKGSEVGMVGTAVPVGGASAAGDAFQYDGGPGLEQPRDRAVDYGAPLPGPAGIGHQGGLSFGMVTGTFRRPERS